MSQKGISMSKLRHNSSAASTLGELSTHCTVTHHANFSSAEYVHFLIFSKSMQLAYVPMEYSSGYSIDHRVSTVPEF